MSIRIAIVDDHPMVLSGLQNMLSAYPEIILTGAYSNGMQLIEGLQQSTPDVLLLDISLPGQTGDELTAIVTKQHPDIRILALTNIDSAISAYNMIRHGVHGYLLKTATQETLIKAIQTIYDDGEFIDPTMQERLIQFRGTIRREANLKVMLSPREKQILQYIVNGETGKEIAQKLFIGVRTVEHYRDNIILKLEVNNTAQLVKKAVLLGLVE